MPKIVLPHRRRKEGKTNYRKRLDLLKSRQARLVVRKSSKNIYCQLVNYETKGDKTVASCSSRDLSKFGWNTSQGNLPAAYLTGLLLGARAKKANLGNAILDKGLYETVHGTRLFAVLKGAIDGGLEIPHSEEAFPTSERVSGKHIADYAAKLKKEKPTNYKKQFSAYLENKVAPEDIPKLFEAVKAKILAEGK